MLSPRSAYKSYQATGNRQPATGNRQPATGIGHPATDGRPLSTSAQLRRIRSAEALSPMPDAAYFRITPNTSSRFCAINSGVSPSRLSRSSGSVFDARTLKCQSGNSAENPSSVYVWPSL
jgi:hypothetical protein